MRKLFFILFGICICSSAIANQINPPTLWGNTGSGYNSSGNIGIGSVNPNSILDVESTVNPVIFFAASGTKANVGIGTFIPGEALDVQGTIRSSLGFINTGGTTGAVLCLTSTGQFGHCASGASCLSTCTCTCTAN